MASSGGFSSFEAAFKLKKILLEKGYEPVINFAFFFSTGLPGLGKIFEDSFTLSAEQLLLTQPCFKSIRFIVGKISNKTVIGVTRRPHFFENPCMAEICFPVNIIYAFGCRKLLLITTACSVNPDIDSGTFLIVKDHINLFKTNPLISVQNDSGLEDFISPKLIPMRKVYSEKRIMLLENLCIENALPSFTGIYAGTTGPFTETPAEYSMIHHIGADCIGMALIPEAMQTSFLGMEFTAGALITTKAPVLGDSSALESMDSAEMMNIETLAEKRIAQTAKGFFAQENLI